MHLPGTISWLELLWSVVAFIGVGVCLWAAVDAIGDRRFQRRSGANGTVLIVANARLRNELYRVLFQTIFLGIGIVAMTYPSPGGTRASTPAGIVVAVGLITIEVALVVAALLDRRDRGRLMGRDEVRTQARVREEGQ